MTGLIQLSGSVRHASPSWAMVSPRRHPNLENIASQQDEKGSCKKIGVKLPTSKRQRVQATDLA
jgi:hypothetical protein